MGGTAKKRLVRKRDLERALSEIEAHPLPNAYLEQYTTPSKVAAEILYLTAYVYDDIIDKTVVLYRDRIRFFIDRDDFDILRLNAELLCALNTSVFVGFGWNGNGGLLHFLRFQVIVKV